MVRKIKSKGSRLWGLQDKIKRLGFKLSSINDLLANDFITFDEWQKVHDDIIDEYLKTWNEITRYMKKNNQGGKK